MQLALFSISYSGTWGQATLELPEFIRNAAALDACAAAGDPLGASGAAACRDLRHFPAGPFHVAVPKASYRFLKGGFLRAKYHSRKLPSFIRMIVPDET